MLSYLLTSQLFLFAMPAASASLGTYLFFSSNNIIENPAVGFQIVAQCTGTAPTFVNANPFIAGGTFGSVNWLDGWSFFNLPNRPGFVSGSFTCPEAAFVLVTLNAQQYVDTTYRFRYNGLRIDQVTVNGVPPGGVTTGGTLVTFRGFGFDAGPIAFCRFGSSREVVVPVLQVSRERLLCATPACKCSPRRHRHFPTGEQGEAPLRHAARRSEWRRASAALERRRCVHRHRPRLYVLPAADHLFWHLARGGAQARGDTCHAHGQRLGCVCVGVAAPLSTRDDTGDSVDCP